MATEDDALEHDVVATFDKVALMEFRLVSVKITPLGIAGFPDKIYLGMGRVIFFVEFKRPKKKAEKLQHMWHKLLRKMGFRVYVVDRKCKETARAICSENIQAA